MVNSSQGGGTKDSFILEPDAAEGPSLMLSRTAANLYWIGRYMERAEFTSRLVEATIRLSALGDHDESDQAWRSALAVVGADAGLRARPARRSAPFNVRRYLTLSEDNRELDPLLPRRGARQCPRRAHRAHRRGLGGDQPRLADHPRPHQPRRRPGRP